MYRIGFVTGCFDLIHQDHIAFLSKCQKRCKLPLVVGLTTDRRMETEKRPPVLPYENRKAILEAMGYNVVPNNGESKYLAWTRYNFDIVFAESGRKGTKEYTEFDKHETGCVVQYVPRGQTTSTTDLVTALEDRVLLDSVIAVGIGGLVHRTPYTNRVIKQINYTAEELAPGGTVDEVVVRTADVHETMSKFGDVPRNWKSLEVGGKAAGFPVAPRAGGGGGARNRVIYPNISGLSPGRELDVNIRFKDEPWCTYLGHKVVFVDDDKELLPHEEKKGEDQTSSCPDMHKFASRLAHDRKYPTAVVSLVQKNGGQTFNSWRRTATPEDIQKVIDNVLAILLIIGQKGVVHGDVHGRNVLVDENSQVTIVDWGWAMADWHELDEAERDVLEHRLRTGFDYLHFMKSIETEDFY